MSLASRLKGSVGRIGFVISVDGRPVSALQGDTLLAAILCEIGWAAFEGRVTPFCGMGACFGCIVEVDGHVLERACLTRAKPGMRVQTGGRWCRGV